MVEPYARSASEEQQDITSHHYKAQEIEQLNQMENVFCHLGKEPLANYRNYDGEKKPNKPDCKTPSVVKTEKCKQMFQPIWLSSIQRKYPHFFVLLLHCVINVL